MKTRYSISSGDNVLVLPSEFILFLFPLLVRLFLGREWLVSLNPGWSTGHRTNKWFPSTLAWVDQDSLQEGHRRLKGSCITAKSPVPPAWVMTHGQLHCRGLLPNSCYCLPNLRGGLWKPPKPSKCEGLPSLPSGGNVASQRRWLHKASEKTAAVMFDQSLAYSIIL